jgi:catechol 2,3-dioxygenase
MSNPRSLLAPSLHIKPSQLYVKDLQKVGNYYHDVVRLEVLESTASHWILGQGQTPVLELISRPEYRTAPMASAGLFHNAIVYASRAELAETILHILKVAPDSFEGSADHLVSEAFYFHDPEFNGLELYFDRPRDTWQWQDGNVKMASLYLDPAEYIMRYLHEKPGAGKVLGHVHLRVGVVPAARRFYVEQLGFDTTADLGSALFVSVGGYHHHMAMNTWFSRGAGLRVPSLGLAEVRLALPNDGSIDQLANRLLAHKIRFEQSGAVLRVDDPWGNKLVLTAE